MTFHVQDLGESVPAFRRCSFVLILSIASLVVARTSTISVRAFLNTYRGVWRSRVVARMRPLISRYVQSFGTPFSCTLKELSRADESLTYVNRA